MKKLTTLIIAALCFVSAYSQKQFDRTTCALIVSTDSVVNISCNGGANGGANAIVKGGTAPYTYLWTPGGSTDAHATGLTAGCYTVTVVDKNGCTGTASVCLTQPANPVVVTSFNTPVKCNGGSTGTLSCATTGGTPGYTYVWTPGPHNGSSVTGMTAGTYTITVTDANGCTATTSTTITQPAALTATVTGIGVSCNGGNDGQASCIPAGGTPNYTYAWSNGGASANDNNLTAGTYTVMVTDKNGCTITATATVTQPAPITVTTTIKKKPSCDTCCDGIMYSTVTGGTPPYTYDWNCTGEHTDTIKDACNGYCNCCVNDAHGCFNCDTVIVSGLQNVTKADIDYSIYPDPNNGHFTIGLSVNTVQAYTIELYNILGQTLSSEVIHPAAGKSTRTMDISAYGKGMYFIAIKSPTGKVMKKVIVL